MTIVESGPCMCPYNSSNEWPFVTQLLATHATLLRTMTFSNTFPAILHTSTAIVGIEVVIMLYK